MQTYKTTNHKKFRYRCGCVSDQFVKKLTPNNSLIYSCPIHEKKIIEVIFTCRRCGKEFTSKRQQSAIQYCPECRYFKSLEIKQKYNQKIAAGLQMQGERPPDECIDAEEDMPKLNILKKPVNNCRKCEKRLSQRNRRMGLCYACQPGAYIVGRDTSAIHQLSMQEDV